MDYKFEINYLNIDNYPLLEKHFKNMAARGWIIHKIFIGFIFIYKKIQPVDLDFSISPYEMETAFTRKTDEDIREFQDISRSLGWNYACKSYDLHIYYKEEGLETLDMQTDEVEEFRNLEKIGSRYLKNQYILLPIILVMSWFSIGGFFRNVYQMRDGIGQITGVLIFSSLILSLAHIVDLRRFLKRNRENMEVGKSIEFNQSNWIYRILFTVFGILFLIFIFYNLYSIFFLDNRSRFYGLIPVFIGVGLALLYRYFIKPTRKSMGFKKTIFVLMIIVAMLGSSLLSILFIKSDRPSKDRAENIDKLKVLSSSDFYPGEKLDSDRLKRDAGIIFPESYDYSSSTSNKAYVFTEYSRAISQGWSDRLVQAYKRQARNRLIGYYEGEIARVLEQEEYNNPYLEIPALVQEDFESLRKMDSQEAKKLAMELIEERSIVSAEDLWGVDEAYFLNFNRDEVLLRQGKEVFYLEGLDFSDPEIIRIARTRLGLE